MASAAPKTPSTRTEREAVRKARYSRDRVESASEIGPPPLTDAQRKEGEKLRELCRNSLLDFNTRIFPNSTGLKPFGQVQIDSIKHDQNLILGGGTICKAEPRAYAKTSRGCNAVLWSDLYGYRRMIAVFSANLDKSKTQIMARWKTELTTNEQLYWMFPELLWPFRALDNKPQRCTGQLYLGKPTAIQFSADKICLPSIDGHPGAGGVMIALPLKSCRGATHTLPNGTILRPDLLVFDDVQNDEDAENPLTIRKLEALIDHTAMMLGGHHKTLSAIMNCTVRKKDDLSERYLKKTSWRRVRYKMLVKSATHEKELWLGKYADIRRSYNPEDPDDQTRAKRDALEFYKSHRAEMDEGAEVTWEWAYTWADREPLEISAIQHAYNILIDLGSSVFNSECQNAPEDEDCGFVMLKPSEMETKISGYERGTFPASCSHLTCKVDVHPSILYWQVWAWEGNFTGYLIDYGTFPEQPRRYFRHNQLTISLADCYPGYDDDARVTAALNGLLHGANDQPGLLARNWDRLDGVGMKLNSVDIDANGAVSDAVKKFVYQSPYSAMMYPSYGRGIKAGQKPMGQWQQAQEKRTGPEWTYVKGKPGDPVCVLFNTNYWKKRFLTALALPPGSQGAIYVYKQKPEHHRRLFEHWFAEWGRDVTIDGRTVTEFAPKPGTDNHDLDCGVGAMVGASKLGISSVKVVKKVKKVMTLEEMARRARGGG